MLFADLRAAHGESLKAGVLNQLACEIAHGTLEKAACRGEFQRLLIVAAGHKIFHLIPNGVLVACLQAQGSAHHDVVAVHQGGVAVGHLQIRGRDGDESAVCGDAVCRLYHAYHLAVIGACVHIHSAAHGAGNAVGKLQTRQAVVTGEEAQPLQRHTRRGVDGGVVQQRGGGLAAV